MTKIVQWMAGFAALTMLVLVPGATAQQEPSGAQDPVYNPVLTVIRDNPDDPWGPENYPYCDPILINNTFPMVHYRHYCLFPIPIFP